MNGNIIRVLIVDDSAVVRQVLSAVLAKCNNIEVIGAVSDPIFAMAKMNQDWPDVVVLDLEMPRMDGITFLKKLMSVRPTSVVICSKLTESGAEITMQALAAGAVGIVTKPKIGLKDFLASDQSGIIQAVYAAAQTDMRSLKSIMSATQSQINHHHRGAVQSNHEAIAIHSTTEHLVAIGTSAGGTTALELVLSNLSRVCPGIVIVQHMPEQFTGAFALRLNRLCEIEIKEAANGDRVIPGRALIAPGGKHMMLKRSGAQYITEIMDGPLVSHHRPSVDVLFRSVANCAGKNALGIIMTGMGDDGAKGLKEMHNAGAATAAQDEASCVVYGMPKEAVKLGAVDQQLPLTEIANLIEKYAKL